MIKAYLKSDVSGTHRAERRMTNIAEKGALEVAGAVVKHVNANWSSSSPSDRGGPPARVTGNLERDVTIQGRDVGGRFSKGKNVVGASIRYNAKYAGRLEKGDLDRPFLQPALEAIVPQMGLIFQRVTRTGMR